MKVIKTQQRYRCDFCKRTGIRSNIERHEKICFRNPNRVCEYCDNEGYTMEEVLEEYPLVKTDCPYCASFDKNKLKEIEERERKEKENNKEINNKEIPIKEIPF